MANEIKVLDNLLRNMNIKSNQSENVEIVDDSMNNTLLDEQLEQNETRNQSEEGELYDTSYHSDDEQVVKFVSKIFW